MNKDNKIHLFNSKKDCCACSACVNVCPKSAISMVADDDGFIFPRIDENLCINCKRCKSVCAFQSGEYNKSLGETYVAVSKNTDVMKSASGGLFASFAYSVLQSGGVVYGCSMRYEDSVLEAKHIRITDIDEIELLKGSKYVQSNLNGSFSKVKNDLEQNYTVLFSGTPCQIAGLKSFLGRDYPNLFTLDVVCHGVPNALMFQDYISFVENRINKKIIDFRFRDKSQGWKLYGGMTCSDDTGTKYVCFEPEESSYYQMFLNSYTYRESCYNCPYANDNRPGDITIGDYWCVELVHPELVNENGGPVDYRKGTSCMIINNKKGLVLLNKYGKGIDKWSSEYDKASKYNAQLRRPSEFKPQREIVFSLYKKGYAELEAWYQKELRKTIRMRKIRAAIPSPIKKMARRLVNK